MEFKTHIRWMIRRDLPEVLAIEAAVFNDPWDDEEFHNVLRDRRTIGMVMEDCGTIVGFMVYSLMTDYLQLLNFAVKPNRQRMGYGTAMIDKLKLKLSQQRRTQIRDDVREGNLGMHLFLRDNGFICRGIERDAFDNGEAAYQFVFELVAVPNAARW